MSGSTAFSDAHWMDRALAEARRGVGRTAPNPPVGCALVRDGRLVGVGFHSRAGAPHAEVAALAIAEERSHGATAYVTLEPCNHSGRTGPCTEALLAAGVRHVVVGALDPNPRVTGGGIARLREAGVSVTTGIRAEACAALIAPFAQWSTRGRPLVTLKVALTLDGRLATATGSSQWVTGERARACVHRLRDQNDAVLVGAGTVRSDNPALTTRLDSGGRDAVPIVVSASLDLDPAAAVFASGRAVVLTGSIEHRERVARLESTGATVLSAPDCAGVLDWEQALAALAQRGLCSVLVEGGASIATSLLRARHVDRLVAFVAPKLVGDDGLAVAGRLGTTMMADALHLSEVEVTRLGDDVCIEGRCVYGTR